MTDTLTDYQDAVRGLSHIDRLMFDSTFIGALSWSCPKTKWYRALEIAKDYIERSKLTTLSPSTGPSERAASGEGK